MFVMSPNDNRVSDKESADALKNRNFGGNRKVTHNIQKDEDYTKPSLERRANVVGDAEEEFIRPSATDDIDDLNDPNARKRETSRRKETEDPDHSSRKYREPVNDFAQPLQSDPGNRPESEHREDDVVKEPDPDAKHGTKNPWHFGESYKKRGDQNVHPRNT